MSDWVIGQAGATFAISMALGAYVALQRNKTLLHRGVTALLFAIMTWTLGLLMVHGSGGDTAVSRAGTIICFFGVMLAPPFWLFICARVANVAVATERPRAFLGGLLAPSIFNFLWVITDPLHGLFANGEAAAIFTAPVTEWAGPIFWVHCAWTYSCTVGGIALCIHSARRTPPGIERTRMLLVAAAAGVPLVSIAILLAGITTPERHITPGDLGISAVLLVTAVLRYRFLETSSIAAREVITHLQEGLVLADADLRVVDVSPAAVALLGRSRPELDGLRLQDILDLLDPSSPIALPNVADLGSVETILPEQLIVTRDGRVVEVSASRVGDQGGKTTGNFLVLRDRTAQHRLEESRQLSQRLQSLGIIAAGIGHEINNPLSFIRTNLAHLQRAAEVIQKNAANFEASERSLISDMDEVLLETLAGVDRIAGIVESTRRLSKAPDPNREPVDINRVCSESLQLAAYHDSRQVTVETAFADDLPEVHASADQIGQVILNLLINAKQAIGGAGNIRVETRAQLDTVEVLVHDDGPGVPEKSREHIFDPFFTTKSPDEGSGLGLAIAYEIARSHDGRLELQDSDLGGACFALTLPSQKT